MAATPSIVVKKQTLFRGTLRTWSNRYHFNGGTPADNAHWTTFSDAVVNAEKACFASSTTIVETIGYAAGSDVPVFTKVYTTNGTLIAPSTAHQQLEVAALARWNTDQRTTKNHPIYLFSYWHAVWCQTGTNLGKLDTGQQTAMTTYATSWVTGFSDGTLTLNRAGPRGASGTTPLVETYAVTHQFPK